MLIKISVVYYLTINLLLLILMGADKSKAKKGAYRIPEATLFIFSLLGGGLGGFFGMRLFHHKNKKWYFHVIFALSIFLHIALLFAIYKLIH